MAYKLRAEKAFTDKETGKEHKVGDLLKVNDARGEELLADPRELVTLIDKASDKPKEAKAKAEKPAEDGNESTDNK